MEMMSGLPPQVLQNRQRSCAACLTKCQPFVLGMLKVTDPQACCPHPQGARWLPFLPSPTLGAGTAFSLVAQPVARGVDVVFGTSLRKCHGCAERKERWDVAVPNIFRPWG